MNRILTTAGLAVLGAASVVPASAQELVTDQKPWAIGAQLRGFYDDNYLTYPKALRNIPGFDDNTFGVDVSPSVSYNLRRDQTTFGVSYLYSLRYYADRQDDEFDHSHQANLKFSHAFNERYSLDLKDSFVMAQEPAILDPSISITVPARSEGDNFRNTAGAQFNMNVLEHFGVVLGYSNSIYDYEQDAGDIAAIQAAAGFPLITGEGSRSAVLDRMEHEFSIDGNYQVLPRTTLSLGYIYGIVDFTSEDPLIVDPLTGAGLPGEIRDWDSHKISLGIRQQINPQFVVSGKAGVEVTAYDAETIWDDEVGPFAEASASWNYTEGSALQVGARHRRVATDVRLLPGVGGGLNADAEATSVFVSVTHRIAAKILLNAMAQYQHGTFNPSSGSSDFADDVFYGGITLAYQFTRNVAAEVGYTYDRLDSDIAIRSFTRNRVFVGTRLSY